MTEEHIRAKLGNIKALEHDAEQAHAYEDMLYQEVLRAIANGEVENPARCARLALQTTHIHFTRWRSPPTPR